MAKVEKEQMLLSGEEMKLLEHGKEYDLIPNQKGVFLLIDRSLLGKIKGREVCVTVPAQEDEKQQVIGLIKKGRLSDLVEGKFEGTLDEKQKKVLLELVVTGKVFVFKLNETYKKGVYRVKDDEGTEEAKREIKESEDPLAKEKPIEEYTIEKDGFLVTKNTERAKQISQQYEPMIRQGFLKGIKSFDGNYYLLQTDLLDTYINKVIIALNNVQTQTLEELAKNISASQTLTRIVCEFLKEEGELLERKKGHYTYIK